MKKFDFLAVFLLILGGINWGLWGVFGFNLIDYIFRELWIERVVYFLVGVAAIYVAISWKMMGGRWHKK